MQQDSAAQERLERSKREWLARRSVQHAPAPPPRPVAAAPTPAAAAAPTAKPPPPTPALPAKSPPPRRGPAAPSPPRRPQPATASRLPEWRARATPDAAPLHELEHLHRDLSLALQRHATARNDTRRGTGMRRLQGPEKDRWAFVDESDVSDFSDRIPSPATVFPFELDDFQKRAILHVEQQQNVFVAAHTSAGKTVVAEYAIALAAQFGGKAFYTSPIKTLSNQKLRDFRTKFDDVGLVTGDVSINENAQCVIMTTEILRSMLYRGADVIRDVMFVVFDEVQFLNDEERGVVWEESIIMLPPTVTIIMLSATVPNALEFASWVGKVREKNVAVVSTMKRPVPLRHAWLHRSPESPEELCETVLLEQGGSFLAENFRSAMRIATTPREAKKQSKNGRKKTRRSPQKYPQEEAVITTGENICQVPENAGLEVGEGKGSVVREANCEENEEGTAKPNTSGSRAENQRVNGEEKPNRDVMLDGNENRREVVLEDPVVREAKRTPNKGVNKNKGPSAKQLASAGTGASGRGPNSRRSPWAPLVSFLHKNDRTPSVIFCFSKKKCERAVDSLENVDLLPDSGQKATVHRFFDESMARLREEDRNLPQVIRVRANLKRGISAHHAGLLPLIKETTEILFSRGLVKVLFATETFAMGVNMPARTVVFAAVRKHDGRRFRFLEAGEYTQMSGRAGRRGLDKVGHVYLFFPPDERFPLERDLAKVMTGQPLLLQSAFRLTYNMILNVLRVDELRVEDMMMKSFSEAGEYSQNEKLEVVLDKARGAVESLQLAGSVAETELEGNAFQDDGQACLRAYVAQFCHLTALSAKLSFADLNHILMEAVVPGRVVIAEVLPGLLSLAIVYSVVPQKERKGRLSGSSHLVTYSSQLWVACIAGAVPSCRFDVSSVLIPLVSRANGRGRHAEAGLPVLASGEGLVVSLRQVAASKIVYICEHCDRVSPDRLSKQEAASRMWYFGRRIDAPKRTLHTNGLFLDGVIREWHKKLHVEELSGEESFPREFMSRRNPETSARRQKRAMRMPAGYESRMKVVVGLAADTGLGGDMRRMKRERVISKIGRLVLEQDILNKMGALKRLSDDLKEPSLLPEYEKRVKVLEKLCYIGSEDQSVQIKGRGACDVSTVDCVVLTEIICENVLHGLKAGEVGSLLSSLVCRKKNAGEVDDARDAGIYSAEYRAAKAELRAVVQKVGKVQEQCGVSLQFDMGDDEDYERSMCRWDLAHAVFAWANGEAFFKLTELTEQQEGDIVVCIKRLSELLRDAQHVAKAVDNAELHEVLEEAVVAIRRDVVFNGSLYYDEGAREEKRAAEEEEEEEG